MRLQNSLQNVITPPDAESLCRAAGQNYSVEEGSLCGLQIATVATLFLVVSSIYLDAPCADILAVRKPTDMQSQRKICCAPVQHHVAETRAALGSNMGINTQQRGNLSSPTWLWAPFASLGPTAVNLQHTGLNQL